MNNKNIFLAANTLFNHRLNKTGLKKLPKNQIPKTIEEAYLIQNELKILYLSLSNNFCIGKKCGCTNLLAQSQLDVYEPFYGNLFSKFSDFTGCKLKSSKFFKPYIEPEISFRIKEDININLAPFKFKDAFYIFDKLLPSIEIVDFRFGKNLKEIGINNLISSNGASEFWIQSNKLFSLEDINLENHIVNLYINGKLEAEGNTKLVLKNPINSAIWLVNKLAINGEPMLKGQYISTGTCTKALPIKKNNFIKADFGTLGSIEIDFN